MGPYHRQVKINAIINLPLHFLSCQRCLIISYSNVVKLNGLYVCLHGLNYLLTKSYRCLILVKWQIVLYLPDLMYLFMTFHLSTLKPDVLAHRVYASSQSNHPPLIILGIPLIAINFPQILPTIPWIFWGMTSFVTGSTKSCCIHGLMFNFYFQSAFFPHKTCFEGWIRSCPQEVELLLVSKYVCGKTDVLGYWDLEIANQQHDCQVSLVKSGLHQKLNWIIKV